MDAIIIIIFQKYATTKHKTEPNLIKEPFSFSKFNKKNYTENKESSSTSQGRSSSFFLFPQEQVLRPPERGVRHHHHDGDRHGHENVDGGVGEQQQRHRENGHGDEHEAVVDEVAEQDEGLVAEEVEEEPRRHEEEEDDERDGVPEEAQEENQQRHHRVVHAEVRHVHRHARQRLRRAAAGDLQRAEVQHGLPRPPRPQPRLDPLLGTRYVFQVRRPRGRNRAVGCCHVSVQGCSFS